MKIEVFCEDAIQKFTSDKPYAVISIQDPDYDFVPLIESDNLKGVCRLKFYDFDRATGNANYDEHLFNVSDAKNILTFVESIKDKIDLLCVHCVAGISRSAGVSAVLSKIYYGDDMYFFQHYCPNMLVYRTILNEHIRVK